MSLYMASKAKCPYGCADSVTVEESEEMQWLIGWWPHEKDGVVHRHDPNRRQQVFRCANGHVWERRRFIPCQACGYTEKPEQVVRYPDEKGNAP